MMKTPQKALLNKTIFLLILWMSSTQIQASETPVIRIINYGIFAHSPDNGKSWINPVSDQKIKGNSASPVHIETTREIPAQHPLFFGFEYQLEKLKTNTTTITTEVTHPPIKQTDEKVSTSYQESNKFLILNGKITAITGYLLEHKGEITNGEWTFKIKHKGKTIITQNFYVASE